MFREILLHDTEKDLHCFFIREPDGKLQDYRMKHLTFGVKPSAYLATQVIQHLARAHSLTHPQASQAFLTDFYVDDILSGAETIREADTLRQQLCDLLLQAGMMLRKWRTSSEELRKSIPYHLRISN